MLSDVWYLIVSNPSIGGTQGFPPVAMHALRNFKDLPFTSTVFYDVKWACPKKTSTPRFLANRSAESLSEIYALISLILAIIPSKSISISPLILTPYYCEFLTLWATLQLLRKALEGTHPVFKQSPPMNPLSIRQTLAPFPLDYAAVTKPPAPAPMTKIS